MPDDTEPTLDDVLEQAADLQRIVPGAVLVGGSAAAYHARHRRSYDHDHVVADLADRFETILGNASRTGDLAHYKGLDPRWHDWGSVRGVLAAVTRRMVAP